MSDKLYRYEEVNYHPGVDEFDNPLHGIGRVDVILRKFDIVKLTPKGVWIEFGCGKKFVNMQARKKYACLTEKDALISFIRRKQKHIEIIEHKKAVLDKALDKAYKLAASQYNMVVERYVEKDIFSNKIIYNNR